MVKLVWRLLRCSKLSSLSSHAIPMKQRLALKNILERVERVWNDARAVRDIPRRTDIDPIQLGSALPHITLLDVVPGDPIDFRYRILGQQLIKGYGFDLTGHQHRAVADKSMMAWPFYDVYVACVTSKQSQPVEIRTRNRLQLPVHVKGTVWPLSEDGVAITGLLGAAMYFVPLEVV
ncbi:MAG: PAS domain-containing protein [Alphaproteobacteria bacterium]|nr:PAS domain-containing protein [Alphaproteobacteria bacterium]